LGNLQKSLKKNSLRGGETRGEGKEMSHPHPFWGRKSHNRGENEREVLNNPNAYLDQGSPGCHFLGRKRKKEFRKGFTRVKNKYKTLEGSFWARKKGPLNTLFFITKTHPLSEKRAKDARKTGRKTRTDQRADQTRKSIRRRPENGGKSREGQ